MRTIIVAGELFISVEKINVRYLLTFKKVKVKCTLVQALRLCTGLRPIGGVEV